MSRISCPASAQARVPTSSSKSTRRARPRRPRVARGRAKAEVHPECIFDLPECSSPHGAKRAQTCSTFMSRRRTISASWRLPSFWQECSGGSSPSRCGPTTSSRAGPVDSARRPGLAVTERAPAHGHRAGRARFGTRVRRRRSRCRRRSLRCSVIAQAPRRVAPESPTVRVTPATRRRLRVATAPAPPEEARLRSAARQVRDAAAISFGTTTWSNEFYATPARVRRSRTRARVWVVADDRSGSGAGSQARASWCREACGSEPGIRLLDVGCGWGGMLLPPGAPPTASAGRRDAVRVSRPSSAPRSGSRGRSLRWGRRPPTRTTTTSRWPLRALDQLDRHVRARRPRAARGSTSEGLLQLLQARGAAAEPRHRPCARIPGQAGARSGTRLHRLLRVPRRRAPRAGLRSSAPSRTAVSRSGTWIRACTSTTRSTLRAWLRQPRGELGRRGRDDRRAPRPCVAALRRRKCRSLEDNPVQVHQVLAVKPDGGTSGMPLRPAFTEP